MSRFTYSTSFALKFIPVRGRKREAYHATILPPALKFIPVRGRKHVKQDMTTVILVEIYPREGTETYDGFPVEAAQLVEIYPREGTETQLCGNTAPAGC